MDPNGWVPLGPSTVFNGQLAGSHFEFPFFIVPSRAPVSGRVTAIAIDPVDPDNVVYVGTALGGVWKTVDGGRTWRPLTDDHLSLAVGAMAIDPNAPHHLYVASGESNNSLEVFVGTGMKIYDPVADTWAFKNDTSPQQLLTDVMSSAIIVDAGAAPNTRILIGTDKGLIESNDNGATWHRVVVPGPGTRVTDLAFKRGATAADDRLYVAIEGDGVYRKDGAGAFTALHGAGVGKLPVVGNLRRITLALCRDHPDRLYALYAKTDEGVQGIYRTGDGGDTWFAVANLPRDTKQANYNAVLAAHPTDQNRVFFGEVNLWRSSTAGNLWTKASDQDGDSPGMHADQHVVAYHPTNPDKVWAGNDGGVWFSTDGGVHWQSRNRGLQTMQYYALAQHPHQESILLVGAQDNGTQRFEGHPAWRLVDFGDGFFCAIDPVDPRFWYDSYVFQPDASKNEIKAISRSDEAGKEGSWKVITDGIGASDTTDSDPFFVPFVLDPTNPQVLYLGTSTLYRTENRGDQWTPIRKASDGTVFSTGNLRRNAITAICVHPDDSNTVYVGTFDGRLFHLHREASGRYTVNDRSATLPGKYIADIAVPSGAPASNKVYVAIGSEHDPFAPNIIPLTDRLFRSDNQGAAWIPLNSVGLDLPPIQGIALNHQSNPVNAIALDPANPTHIYIGCEIGVFKSINEGVDWTPFRENLPNSAIADMQLHNEKRLLRVATIGRGVWERRLDPLPGTPQAGLYVRENLLDVGRRASLNIAVPNPFKPTEILQPHSSPDILVDTPFPVVGSFQTPKSTVDYTEGGAADYIGFVQMEQDSPRSRSQSRVYVEALNRGPDDANQVTVRVFFAAKSGDSFPNLPADFWTAYPDADPADTSVWKPLGPKQVIAKLRPAEPQVLRWDWDVPSSLEGTVGLLAVITGNEDPLTETRFDVGLVGRENNHVALREVGVGISSVAIVISILSIIGLAVLVGAAIASEA